MYSTTNHASPQPPPEFIPFERRINRNHPAEQGKQNKQERCVLPLAQCTDSDIQEGREQIHAKVDRHKPISPRKHRNQAGYQRCDRYRNLPRRHQDDLNHDGIEHDLHPEQYQLRGLEPGSNQKYPEISTKQFTQT